MSTAGTDRDLLRALAVLALALMHVVATWWEVALLGSAALGGSRVVHGASQVSVPLFFLVSMLVLAQRRADERLEPAGRWVLARLRELALPVGVWLGLYWVVGVALRRSGVWAGWLVPVWPEVLGEAAPVVALHVWYLGVLLQLVVVFPLVQWGVERVAQERTGRVLAVLGALLALKWAWSLVLPPSRSGAGEWAGFFAPYWLDTVVFALAWQRASWRLPESLGARARLEWLGLLGLALVISVAELLRWFPRELPQSAVQVGWRFGNMLVGLVLFSVLLLGRGEALRRLPAGLARWGGEFARQYGFGFYLAHVLLLVLAAGVEARWLHLGPGLSLAWLLMAAGPGTLGVLWLLSRVPRVGALLGVHRT